jgi:hypothetical protein
VDALAGAGEFGAALEAAREIEDEELRAKALAAIAEAQAKAGLGERAVETAEMILTRRNELLPQIAAALIEAGDRANFQRLLVPCAYYPDAAYRMCGLLARLYSDQAAAVARAVRTF